MPDDADLIVRWWITRPEGWEDLILTEIEERARQTEDAHAAADVVREQRRRRAAEQRAQTAETARDESLEHITSLRAENDALAKNSRITSRTTRALRDDRRLTARTPARQRPAPSSSRPTCKVIRSRRPIG